MRPASAYFHDASKNKSANLSGAFLLAGEWPREWTTTFYKDYPRLPKLALPVRAPKADFFSLIKTRESRRDFSAIPLAKESLGTFLKYVCGTTTRLADGRFRRAHPSPGARFPTETYFVHFRSGGDLPPGVYHYNVAAHALDVLWERAFSDAEIETLLAPPIVTPRASGLLVLTALFYRTQNKYGERGYRQALIEAGHIGQNAYLAAGALGLKCCALSGTLDDAVEALLDIDGVTESLVYALALGT